MTHLDRPTIRCSHCGLNQWIREKCRKCHKPFVEWMPPSLPSVFPEHAKEDHHRPLLAWFPKRLRELRCLRGITQKQLAETMGAIRPYVSKLENSHAPNGPLITTCDRIAAALSLPIGALVEQDELLAWACVLAHVGTERHRIAVLAAAEKMATAAGVSR